VVIHFKVLSQIAVLESEDTICWCLYYSIDKYVMWNIPVSRW